MASTLVEKIIARASGRSSVLPGQIVTCKVDLAVFHESDALRQLEPRLRELGARVWDPQKVLIVSDHERSHLTPGAFCASADSHSSPGGAFGCYMVSFEAAEMVGVMATGEIWVRVPETVLVRWSGDLPDGITAKDIVLYMCRHLGTHNSLKVIEYAGSTVEHLSMSERMVLTNMAADLGAETGIVAPDSITLGAIRSAGGEAQEQDFTNWRSDPDAAFESCHELDASRLVPQVARPNAPADAAPVTDAQGQRIHEAYIGACAGAKLSELRMDARVLEGRKVASGVRLLVTPASPHIANAAQADGTLAALMEAGATLLPSGCDACSDPGARGVTKGEVCISSTDRSCKIQASYADAEMFLGSPYTVAASAVEGRIADPRPYLERRSL